MDTVGGLLYMQKMDVYNFFLSSLRWELFSTNRRNILAFKSLK